MIKRERLSSLKKAIRANSRMSSWQKTGARASANKLLGYSGRRTFRKPALRPQYHASRTQSDRLMRDGFQEIGEVILGWISEPVQKTMDLLHIARGSARVVEALEEENPYTVAASHESSLG